MTLEELLNKLIEKGWKPFDRNFNGYEHGCLIREFITKDGVYSYGQYPTTYRELCAKESGLWQFVCENGLTIVKHPNENKYPRDKLEREEHRGWTQEQGYYGEPVKQNKWYNWDTAEYRLIESALKDESELESFILENIKIG